MRKRPNARCEGKNEQRCDGTLTDCSLGRSRNGDVRAGCLRLLHVLLLESCSSSEETRAPANVTRFHLLRVTQRLTLCLQRQAGWSPTGQHIASDKGELDIVASPLRSHYGLMLQLADGV